MRNNNARNTNARDAAVRFWGNRCGESVKGFDATCCIMTDTVATDGHLILKLDVAECLDYTPNEHGRISTMDPNKAREVLTHYFTDMASAEAPAELFGHMKAAYGRFFGVGAMGRWMSFVADCPDCGMRIQDGAETEGAAGAFCMRFDARTVAKIFQRFTVKSLEFVAPTRKDRDDGFARFHVSYRGTAFTVSLLSYYRNEVSDEAGELAATWHADDVEDKLRRERAMKRAMGKAMRTVANAA